MEPTKPLSSFKGGRLYSLKGDGFPENSAIIRSPASRAILYRPHIAGKELQGKMEAMGEVFVRAMSKTALKGVPKRSIVELVYLAGGLFYGISSGFKRVHGFAPSQCFIGVKRFKQAGSEGSFSASSSYENFEALPCNPTAIIGDTIATGATMARGLESLGAALKNQGKNLKKLIVCTLACSQEGLRALNSAGERLKAENPELEIHFFAAEQLFALMPDGTDLRFLGPGSIMPPETLSYTEKAYGSWLGKNMKCAVFDWGTRCKNPERHYQEFVEYAEKELKRKDIPPEAERRLLRMKNQAEKDFRALWRKL